VVVFFRHRSVGRTLFTALVKNYWHDIDALAEGGRFKFRHESIQHYAGPLPVSDQEPSH
jgi:hypothetical protein